MREANMSLGNKIADDAAARWQVDRLLDQGKSFTFIAQTLTYGGFTVTPDTVSKYAGDFWKKVSEEGVAQPPRPSRRDAAALIKDRMLDAIEYREQIKHLDTGTPIFDILDKDLQPALKTALAAQYIEDRREQKKPQQNFWIQLYTQSQEIPALGDGATIEGESVELD